MVFVIYKVDTLGYVLEGPRVIEEYEGAPEGWVRLPEASIPEGHYARWQGEWTYDTEGPPVPEPPVPEKISNLQARACLRMRGIIEDVQAAINLVAAGDPGNGIPAQPAMLDYWNFAIEFHRNHFGIAIIASLMGWTSEFVDEMFREAITYY